MIFKQALKRELSKAFGASMVVLVTIVMSMMLIRTLGWASKGAVNPQEVFLIMAYSVMGHAPTILALALFIAVTSSLARMVRDNEVVIWLSSGQSVLSFVTPLFSFAAPIFISIAFMALTIWPWSNAQLNTLRERYEQRGDLERIAPGEFQESANGQRIIYVDKSNFNDLNHVQVKNVFMVTTQKDKEVITSAQRGHLESIDGQRYMVLSQGQQITNYFNKAEMKLIEFETMGTLVSASEAQHGVNPPNARSTRALLGDLKHENQGELFWRFGIVLASINLMLLALASASMQPRTMRSGQMLFAILAFVTYYNFINVGQNWIASSRLGLTLALLMLHGSVLLVNMLWLVRRHYRP